MGLVDLIKKNLEQIKLADSNVIDQHGLFEDFDKELLEMPNFDFDIPAIEELFTFMYQSEIEFYARTTKTVGRILIRKSLDDVKDAGKKKSMYDLFLKINESDDIFKRLTKDYPARELREDFIGVMKNYTNLLRTIEEVKVKLHETPGHEDAGKLRRGIKKPTDILKEKALFYDCLVDELSQSMVYLQCVLSYHEKCVHLMLKR